MSYTSPRNSRSPRSRTLNSRTTFALAAFVLLALVTAGALIRPDVATANQFGGSIFTSTFDGLHVNMNIYNLRSDVYLNGGPQNENSSGLPPSETFYFQVT